MSDSEYALKLAFEIINKAKGSIKLMMDKFIRTKKLKDEKEMLAKLDYAIPVEAVATAASIAKGILCAFDIVDKKTYSFEVEEKKLAAMRPTDKENALKQLRVMLTAIAVYFHKWLYEGPDFVDIHSAVGNPVVLAESKKMMVSIDGTDVAIGLIIDVS